MWTYQTTSAFTADTSRASSSASLLTSSYRHWTAVDAAYTESASYSASAITVLAQYASYETLIIGFFSHTSLTFSDGGGTASDSQSYTSIFSRNITADFSSSSTNFYSYIEINGVAVTVLASSSSATTSRTRDSYRSTTVSTTLAINEDATTTQTATRSRWTTNTASAVVTTSEATTQTTSTTSAATVTRTTYSTVASTTLSAPIVTVGISELDGSELGYVVTFSGHNSGWASDIGSTWSKRTGTLASSSSSWATSGASTYSTSGSVAVTSGSATTLTTTYTRTTADTYNPNSSWVPASATATRSFTLISTSTVGSTINKWTTSSTTFSGVSSAVPTAASTITVTATSSLECTFNPSPTVTAIGALCVTWTRTSAIATIRRPASVAELFTYSESFAAPDTGTLTSTTTVTTSTATTANTTVTDTVTDTVTETTSATATSYGFSYSTSYTEACGIAPGTETLSTTFILGGNSYSEYDTITHDSPNPHTVSADFYISGTVTLATGTSSSTSSSTSSHTTTSATSTGSSVSTSDTYTFGIALTTSSYSSSNFNGSFTYPVLHGGGIATHSATLAAIQMRPNQGFIRPDALASTNGLAGNLELFPAATIFYPHWATQADSNGPATPMLYTDGTAYSSGASYFSAQWVQSVGSLKWSSYKTTTTVTGTGTATGTATTVSGSSSGSGAFSSSTARTWYSGETSASPTQGSRIGGIANRTEFGAAVTFAPGVRHWTHHQSYATSSVTDVLSVPDQGATYSEGYAIPTRTETALRVGLLETGFTFDDLTAWSGGKQISAAQISGLLNPATTSLSKYPSL